MTSNLLSGSEPSTVSNDTMTPDSTSFNEGFTEGGDLTLRSLDDVDFKVHSLLLSIASPVFSDIVATGTKHDIIALTENSDLVALMLKFIYPKPAPVIPSFDTWTKAMEVARKYQLERMHSHLRGLLSIRDSPTSIYADPLRALGISLAEGFHEEIKLASSVASRNCRFQDVDELIKMAEIAPEATPWIKLVGARMARTGILMDVLFSFHKAPMLLSAKKVYHSLYCEECFDAHSHLSHTYSPPEWQARWAHFVFEEIQDRPVNEWDEFFGVLFLIKALHRSGVTRIIVSSETCTCLEEIKRHESDFLQWTSTVRKHLEKRLKSLDRLESLE